MKFSLKLAMHELLKNKSKVLIAIIVTLILFMSAFTLCNIATALPENFYNYYEDYMNETIGVYISNADEKLFVEKDKYFEEFRSDVNIACKNFKLQFDGKEVLPYTDIKDQYGNIIYTNYFTNVLLNKDTHTQEEYQDFILEGDIWQTFEEKGVWISQKAFNELGAKINDEIEYVFNDTVIKIKINGVFDSVKLKRYLTATTGSNVNEYILFTTETQAREILFASNTTYNAYGIVGEIDRLYNVYNTLSKSYNLSEGIAFSLIKQVKNAEIICIIVGIIMLVGGVIIMLNFINMIIAMNVKHISLMRILGAKTYKIVLAYYLIFMLLITIICCISWATLPLYNLIVSVYCENMGYAFNIGINYGLVFGVFMVCYAITTVVMIIKWQLMERTTPSQNILEED